MSHIRVVMYREEDGGRAIAVLSHGLVKEDRVPPTEIDRAAERKRQFDRHPTRHTFAED